MLFFTRQLLCRAQLRFFQMNVPQHQQNTNVDCDAGRLRNSNLLTALMINRSNRETAMKKLNKKPKILNTNDAKTFAARIRDLEDEIKKEELHSDDKFDWRSIKVGEVGSDSWNTNTQEIELELERLRTQSVKSAAAKALRRIKHLAGIAMPKVESLALKQAKKSK